MGFISKFFNKDKEGLEKEQSNEASSFHPFPYGSTGTSIYSGYYDEDYLEALKNNERADVYDKMRRSDPQIKMCLSAVKNPIKSAAAEINPAGDDFYYQKWRGQAGPGFGQARVQRHCCRGGHRVGNKDRRRGRLSSHLPGERTAGTPLSLQLQAHIHGGFR